MDRPSLWQETRRCVARYSEDDLRAIPEALHHRMLGLVLSMLNLF